mgnify:CR=1 FL=1
MSQLPDIPRLYTALAEWLACMVYVLALRRRVEGWKLALESGLVLAALSAFLWATGGLPVAFWLPCMAGAVGIMYYLIFLCGDVGPMDALYYCVQAFVLAEFAASLEWQLHCFSCWTGRVSGGIGCFCCWRSTACSFSPSGFPSGGLPPIIRLCISPGRS